MMATEAFDKLGNISRDNPDVCVIFEEDEGNYYGNWVTGFGFTNVRFPKATTRELTAEEKDRYDGVGIQIGNGFVQILCVKDQAEADKNAEYFRELVTVKRPDDPAKQAQLQAKLQEYKARIDRWAAPELQMDTICKIAVLEKVLKSEGEVYLPELADEMMAKYGSGFNHYSFNNACSVISDYCLTGGQKTRGGTGLPSA
jgi:hypothetical protein